MMVDLKSMSRKEKIEYIWDYYKLHIIGTIIVIAVIASFVHSQITRVEYVANLSIFGNYVNEDKRVKFEQELTNLVVKEEQERKQAFVEVIATDKSELGYQMMQKFMAKIAAGEIDVAIMDKSLFDNFVKQDMFLPLESVGEIDLSHVKQQKIEAEGSNNKAVFALSVEGNKVLEDIGYDTKNKIIGIIASSKNKDNGVLILKEFLK